MAHHLVVPTRVPRVGRRIAPLVSEALVEGVFLVIAQHRVVHRIVAVEGFVQGPKVQLEAAPAAQLVLVIELVFGGRLGHFDTQTVLKGVLGERLRARKMHLRVGKIHLERLPADALRDRHGRQRNTEVRARRHVEVPQDSRLRHGENQGRRFGPSPVDGIAGMKGRILS